MLSLLPDFLDIGTFVDNMSGHQNISEHFLSAREKSLEKKVVHLETQLQVYKSQIGKPVHNYRYCLGARNEFKEFD